MQIRKWLALLVSAALALSLLAGCGGSKALSDVIADLLSGQYANVTVEIDPDLEGDLRQAVHEGETDAEIRAALEKILGSGVSFRLIGDGQQGDSAWDLILYPGSDPDAAARSAFTEWNKVFGSLPRDGQYTAQIAMIETENGYAILVKATVDKAASRNDDDDDEPEEPEDPGYTDDGEGNYTVTTADGLKNVAKLVNEEGKTDIDITLTGNIDLTGDWTPIGTSIRNAYKGTFDGGNYTITGLTVTTSDQYAGLFGFIGSGGAVMNVKLEGVKIESNSDSGNVGGVAGWSYGNIENCSVSGSVSGSGNNGTAGGVVGFQVDGSLTGCSSSATVNAGNAAGGIAGSTNGGASLTGCYATGSVSVENNTTNAAWAGGVVGSNGANCTLTACYATGNVTGGTGSIYVGGVTGTNDSGTLTACYHATGTVSGPDGTTGGVTGRNFEDAILGKGTLTACYWSGLPDNDNGGATQVTGDVTWQTAYQTMNTALSGTGTGWQYIEGDDGAPLTLTQN